MTQGPKSTARRFYRFLMLGFLSGALVGAEAAAQVCTDTCAGDGTCIFGGMLNIPLGEAVISITPDCELLVDNIGPSTQDGVLQTGLDSVYMRTTLATPNFSGAIGGTLAEIRLVGFVDGLPGGELMVTRLADFGDGINLVNSINCTGVQVAGYQIDAYIGTELVATIMHHAAPPLFVFPKVDVRSIACGILPDQNLTSDIRFAAPVPVTIFTLPGQPTVVLDSVFITAFDPSVSIGLQTDIENRFHFTGPVTMTSMFRSDTLPVGAGRVPDGNSVPGTPLTIDYGSGGDLALSWSASCLATDTDYGIYEGVLGNFSSHVKRSCSTAGATNATLTPSAGDSYYLVVPSSGLAEGSYGLASDGSERPWSSDECWSQLLGASCP